MDVQLQRCVRQSRAGLKSCDQLAAKAGKFD
jgi:hypothetical protein